MNKSTFGIIVLSISLLISATGLESAYAAEVKIENGRGSSEPGCELTNLCFIPAVSTAHVGDKIIFLNGDDAPHTSTSGNPSNGPDGFWDSGLQQPGVDFVFMATNPGSFDYFCMVHPWMIGQLEILPRDDDMMVQEKVGTTEDDEVSIIYGDIMPEISQKEPSVVNEVFANIVTNDAEKGTPLVIEVEFLESDGFVINHVNYDIVASQNGKVILADNGAHRHLLKYPVHTTDVLEFDPKTHPVDIDVTFQGIGHFVGSLTEESILGVYGPIGQTSTFQVVPEFGVVVSLVLVVSIVAVIALSTKTRLVQKF